MRDAEQTRQCAKTAGRLDGEGKPFVECPERHLTTNRGVEAGPPATAARRRNLHVTEHPINGCGAHREQLRLLGDLFFNQWSAHKAVSASLIVTP